MIESRLHKFLLPYLICFVSVTVSAQNRYTVTDETASGPGSPSVIVLRDEVAGVEVAVAPEQGGELSSYRVKRKGEWIELLYRARDYSSRKGFQGRGPFLWPAVGGQYPVGTLPKSSCSEGTYVLDGKTYPIPCHGFAKSLPWSVIRKSATKGGANVVVELRDSELTRPSYPFSFKVDASYELSNGHVTINYTVNSDQANTAPMIFSIGNHIAFKIPFLKGTNPADMTIRTPNTTQILRDSHNLMTGETKPNSFDEPKRLGDFDATIAIPLAGYRGNPYALLSDPQGLTVRISQTSSSQLPEPVLRFNLYGGPRVGYFCPEPWFGISNSLNTKQALITLAAGRQWKWRLEFSLETAPPDLTTASPGVERVASGLGFTEGPVWTRQGALIFSDIFNSRIMKWMGTGAPEIYRNFSYATNGNSMDSEGRLYSCVRDRRAIVRQEKDGSLTVIASKWDGKLINSPNDVVVRRDGQVYFSDPISKGVLEPQELGFAGVYHVTPKGKISLVTRKLPWPNGVALTPDGKTLYVADSGEKRVYAYDLDRDGNTSHERVFISDIEGTPDGLRVAANGRVYVACKGIAIYTPEGQFVQMIRFPETPTNCTFGGPDLKTLYVTASTSVYRVRIPDQGALQY